MLMKVHSYLSTNGELSEKARTLKEREVELKRLIGLSGGQRTVEDEAESAWEKAVAAGETTTLGEVNEEKAPSAAPEFEPNIGSTTPPLAPPLISPIRRRLRSVSPALPRARHFTSNKKDDDTSEDGLLGIIDALTWSSNEGISKLSIEMTDLRDALVSKGVARVQFPNNVTFINYLDYLLVPSLVYELEFPRLQR